MEIRNTRRSEWVNFPARPPCNQTNKRTRWIRSLDILSLTSTVTNQADTASNVVRGVGIDRLAAVFAALVGALVIVGWALDIETLKRLVPNLVAMNPSTAFAFIFLAISVWASHFEDGSQPVIIAARYSAFVVLIIGSLKLCELTTGWFPGVDQILFIDKLSADSTGVPNRMAPNTAFNFVLLSVAIIFPRRKQSGRIDLSTVLIVLSIFGSFLPIIGYLYGTKPFYGVGQFIPMALHTAFTFLILGLGLLFARPGRPLVATVSDNGMSGIMVRRLLPAVIGLPILLGWLRLEGQKLDLYDNELGAALVVVVQILLLAIMVSWNSFILLRIDKERRDAESKLAELVLTDDLTGLRNRRGFTLLGEHELKLANNKRMGIVLWCLYADLDGLKKINDTLGHDAGSQAIVNTATVLKATFREADIIARLGGDEFAILAATNTSTGGNLLIERLQANVAAFNAGNDLRYKLSLSVGLVPVEPDEMHTLDEILKAADAQMYSNKQERKNLTSPTIRLVPTLV